MQRTLPRTPTRRLTAHTLLSQKEKLALSQLGLEKMLLPREGHCLRDDVLTACTKASAQFRHVFESDHLESILRLARISHEEVAKGLVSWHNWFI
ncbi:MAG: LysR substrate-binding domain-containing protein [Acidobacteriota bacterium]